MAPYRSIERTSGRDACLVVASDINVTKTQ
jgi:hypothetical protein